MLYGRHGVLEYWMVDPESSMVEVMVLEDDGLTSWAVYPLEERLSSRLLPGLAIALKDIFGPAT